MRRITIIQGEQLATGDANTCITTLLGSCIAVCLHDAVAKVGGMNHFLLGQPDAGQQVSRTDLQRYGVHAMELLINAMMSKGATRGRLRAHIYGGATIVSGLGAIGSSNAAFARRFIETEGIGIGHIDVGGRRARRVEFLPFQGKARSMMVAEPVPVQAPQRTLAPVGELELF